MPKVAEYLRCGVARSMLKKGEGGWCARSCFGLRCVGGEVSWRHRGGFSICNKVSGVMFKTLAILLETFECVGRITKSHYHEQLLWLPSRRGLSVMCSFERGSINAAAVSRRPPDWVSTHRLLRNML